MTARNAAALASLAALCGSAIAGCTGFYEMPIETPSSPRWTSRRSARAHRRIHQRGTEDVDANLETVRLLRSQLRIEVLAPRDRRRPRCRWWKWPRIKQKDNGNGGGSDHVTLEPVAQVGSNGAPPDGQKPPDAQSHPRAEAASAEAGRRRKHADRRRASRRSRTRKTSSSTARSSPTRLLEEDRRGISEPAHRHRHGALHPAQASGSCRATVKSRLSAAAASCRSARIMERKGFILQPKFVFIDGRTGATLYSESYKEEVLYSAQQNTPALSSYFELMDRLVPSFLSTLSTQKIRGTRVLLK